MQIRRGLASVALTFLLGATVGCGKPNSNSDNSGTVPPPAPVAAAKTVHSTAELNAKYTELATAGLSNQVIQCKTGDCPEYVVSILTVGQKENFFKDEEPQGEQEVKERKVNQHIFGIAQEKTVKELDVEYVQCTGSLISEDLIITNSHCIPISFTKGSAWW